jgi:putative endonuclease
MNASPSFNKRAWGDAQEGRALDHLKEKGLDLVQKNYRFGRAGEIDLVMLDDETWVFIEVKARRTHEFGPPEDAITPRKRSQIKRIARGFFHEHQITSYVARFDVVAVDYVTGQDGEPEIRHWENAFL